jgi:hypothetical protein
VYGCTNLSPPCTFISLTHIYLSLPFPLEASVKCFVSLQFLNLRQQDSLDEGSAKRKAATYTGHRINADKYPYLEWNSNPRSQGSSRRRHFMP